MTFLSPILPSSYIVQDGDTPARISATLFNGNPNLWQPLLDFNGIRDPRTLKAGMVLRVPAQ